MTSSTESSADPAGAAADQPTQSTNQSMHKPPPGGTRGLRSGLRVVLVVVLAIASTIPLLIVDGVATERQRYFAQAQHDVANSWGLPQQLIGPLLVVPVDYSYPPVDKGWQKTPVVEPVRRKHIVLLPDELLVDAVVGHELRQRAIYEVALFSAALSIDGHFNQPRERIAAHVASLGGRAPAIDWSGAVLVLGVSDPRAIRLSSAGARGAKASAARGKVGSVRFAGVERSLQAGRLESIVGNSVQVPVTLPAANASDEARFSLQLGLGTTGDLAVNALGGVTRYKVDSSWPHPSFSGAHSPISRTITDQGFNATWEVHGLARNLPDMWIHEDQPRSLDGAQMKVSFYNPVTSYTIIDRGIKYGLLFIALTFLTFLCFELTGGVRFHVVQYAVISLELIMFYMTLLATSEHLPFGLSYVLATGLIAALLGAYTWAMTKAKLITITIVAVLLGLYATLFILLALEDFALLMGTGLLLLGLIALMFATRRLHITEGWAATPPISPTQVLDSR